MRSLFIPNTNYLKKKKRFLLNFLRLNKITIVLTTTGRIGVIRSTTGPSSLNLFSNKDQVITERCLKTIKILFNLFIYVCRHCEYSIL